MVHDATLHRLEVIVCFGLDAGAHYEREEDVQSDLERALSNFQESLIVGLKDPCSDLSDALAVITEPAIQARPIIYHFGQKTAIISILILHLACKCSVHFRPFQGLLLLRLVTQLLVRRLRV